MFPQQERFSPLSQLAILFGLCCAGILIGSFATLLAADLYLKAPLTNLAQELMKGENANLSRLLQFLSTFFFMALPAVFFSVITQRKPFQYLGFNMAPSGKQTFLIVGIVFTALFVSGSLGELNQLIPLSKGLTKYFQSLEDEYSKEVIALINLKSSADYIIALIIIAFLPALFEEMFFRGCLQQLMIILFRNTIAGIIVTSLFFSAIHLSFYGFLPRLFLGIMLGYIFYYSKNLWLNIAAHFLNNAFAVTQMYALSRAGKLNTESMDENFPLYYGLVAIVAFYFIFVIFKRESEFVISMHNMRKYADEKNEEETF
ncbi:MAG: type II CAAX endopeptidase family protein [Parafilimonas sp.]